MATLQSKIRRAVDAMGRGARLMQMHNNGLDGGLKWYLVPGWEVEEEVAKALIERPDVTGSGDGLFPGISQTYRLGDAGE